MEFVLGNLAGKLVRLGAVIAIASTLGACSIMPDWLGGDSGSSDNTIASSDTSVPPPDQGAAPAATADNGQFPDLADTPARPNAPSTSDQQKQVADSLAADRSRQNYSADALRAGNETAATPPGAAPPPDEVAPVDTGSKRASKGSDASSSDNSSADNSGGSSAAPVPAPTTAVSSAPAPAGPPSGIPAVPASTVIGAQSVGMTDSALGFQPSKAPPLDASVAQFVPMPIMSRYQQTAALGGAPGLSGSPYVGGGPAVAAVPSRPMRAMGGPENMSGAVVANFDALQGGAVAPGVYSNAQGLPPAAVVYFSKDTTILNADAKSQVRAAADSFNARGGTGYIRIVGHSSTSSSKMSESRRMQIDFEHSQARATSVARELIKDGVPASKVLVEAVGDQQPVYAEGAPAGTDSNRRAEIFFQG